MSEHRTFIATDYPSEIIVRPASPDDGRWYPVLAWIHRSGLYPLLPQTARNLLEVLLWQRWEQKRPQVVATVEEVACWLGFTPKAVYSAQAVLLDPPPDVAAITGTPARLLAKHGPTVWEPLPGRSFASRTPQALPAPPEMDSPQGECRFTLERKLSPQGENALGNARAPNQTQEEKTETGFGAVIPSGFATVAFVERYAKARSVQGGLGWGGFPLIWNLDGCLSPRLALGCFEVSDWKRDALLSLVPDLTVAEIDHVARAIKSRMRGVDEPPAVLCWRLARAHGKHMPKCERGADRARSLEELRERRVQEAVRAAGGRA